MATGIETIMKTEGANFIEEAKASEKQGIMRAMGLLPEQGHPPAGAKTTVPPKQDPITQAGSTGRPQQADDPEVIRQAVPTGSTMPVEDPEKVKAQAEAARPVEDVFAEMRLAVDPMNPYPHLQQETSANTEPPGEGSTPPADQDFDYGAGATYPQQTYDGQALPQGGLEEPPEPSLESAIDDLLGGVDETSRGYRLRRRANARNKGQRGNPVHDEDDAAEPVTGKDFPPGYDAGQRDMPDRHPHTEPELESIEVTAQIRAGVRAVMEGADPSVIASRLLS